MKNSLRTLALAGALALAGTAMAQETPTVTQQYRHVIEGYSIDNFRYGTAGHGGYVYALDAQASNLIKIGPEGVVSTTPVAGAAGRTLTADQAGNFIFRTSWTTSPGTNGNIAIIPADGGEVINLTIDFTIGADADVAAMVDAGRMDILGRALGDVMSAEGGILFFGAKGSKAIYMAYIAEGQQAEFPESRYTYCKIDEAPNNYDLDTATVIQPLYATLDEYMDAGDDAAGSFAIRYRGVKAGSIFEAGEKTVLTVPAGVLTGEGFDVFYLGGQLYQVLPGVSTDAYNTGLTIADADGNVIYNAKDEPGYQEAYVSGQTFQGFNVEYVDEYTVNVYQLGMTTGGSKCICGMWTVSLPKPVTLDPLYIRGNDAINGWSTTSEQFEIVDGKYVYHVESAGDIMFKISKTDGTASDWSDFNEGVIGIADDNQTVFIDANTKYTLILGQLGNTAIAAGTYDITVDPQADGYILQVVGTPAPVVYPEHVYIVGELATGKWAPETAVESDSAENGVYTWNCIEFVDNGWFRFLTTTGSWADVNAADQFGAVNNGDTPALNTEAQVVKGGNAWNLNATGEHKLVLDLTKNTLVVSSASGIGSIEAEANTNATYYNLQGVRVNGNLGAGVYVKVANGKASKVFVK